jgi:hypothetical protein
VHHSITENQEAEALHGKLPRTGGTMRSIALVFVFLSATVVLANNRQWQEAKVTRIASSTEDNGVVVGTVGTTVVGGRVQSESTFYWIETADTFQLRLVPAVHAGFEKVGSELCNAGTDSKQFAELTTCNPGGSDSPKLRTASALSGG